MPAEVKKCRVCGKNYEACRTPGRAAGVFRWQEVACSPECGAEYLRLVTQARAAASSAPEPNRARRRAAPVVEAAVQAEVPAFEASEENQGHEPSQSYAETPV